MFTCKAPTLKTLALAAALSSTALISAPAAFAEKYASIVIDVETDQVLHARHADEARYPASLTKVMTLYMLFDALKAGDISLDEDLTVSKFAASQAPSNLRLKRGDTLTVADAIDALITKSANDVAVVVAERIGGTEKRFAQLMTVKAKSLGMDNTRFRNASGLPNDQQVSTARDMAMLAEAVLDNHGDYYHYFSQTRFTWGTKTYKNHNALLGTVAGVDGIKTGYTRASGFNLMTSAERDGNRIVAIMLGGNTSKSRNQHVEALVEAAFDAYEGDGDPQLRARQSFASIQAPIHPDAAAEPMLNGVLLSAIAQGGSDDDAPTVATAKPAAPAQLAQVAPAPKVQAPVAPKHTAPAAQPDAAPAPLTVAEYEARQLSRVQ